MSVDRWWHRRLRVGAHCRQTSQSFESLEFDRCACGQLGIQLAALSVYAWPDRKRPPAGVWGREQIWMPPWCWIGVLADLSRLQRRLEAASGDR